MSKAPTRTYLKPTVNGEGRTLTVRDPRSGKKLKPEGEAKVLNTYWRRRLAEGSVVKCGAPPKPAPKPAAVAKVEPAKVETAIEKPAPVKA